MARNPTGIKRVKNRRWSWDDPPQKCGNPNCLAETLTDSDNCPKCFHLYDYEVGGDGCFCAACTEARENSKKEDAP
ncbi:MAG: hypothetical protein AAB390_05125 [Patescibacteria group bacterium]